MREVDINSGGLQRGPVRGAEAGGGGHRAGADNGSVCPSKVFLSGRERGERAGRPAGRRYIEALHDGTDRLHLSSLSLCAYLSSASTLNLPSPRLHFCEDVLRSHFCYMVLLCLC